MHSNRRSFLGLGAAAAAALMLTSMHVPEAHAGIDIGRHPAGTMISIHNPGIRPVEVSFVDGVYVVPGGEQLRIFYHDLYRPYGPTRTVAAMQPDNGAGQVSGDRAQSVGRAGDLKATRPDGVKSGTTPGAKSVDATRRESWLRRIGPWLFHKPVPS